MFAVLGDLSGASFLDIFSGSGIVALEAASRGAAIVEAVEMDALKRNTILENVQISPVRIRCRFMAAELYVKRAKHPFDIIFCDPPFDYRYKLNLVEAIAASKLIKEDTLLLLHHPGETLPDSVGESLRRVDSREYGRSNVIFYRSI